MADNPYARFAPPQNRQAVVIADPYRAREESRKDEDQANEAERIRMAQEAAAREAAASLRAAQTQTAELYAKGLRVGSNGEIERIPGWTPLPTAESAAAEGKEGSRETKLRTLIEQIDRVDQLYRANLEGGFPNAIAGRVPGFIRQENEQFDAAAAGLAEQGLSAFRVPGVGSQSDAELRQFVQANRPLPTDSDLAIEEKLRTLRLRAQAEIDALAPANPANPAPASGPSATAPLPHDPAPPNALTRLRIGNPTGPQSAPFGATEGQSAIVPPEMSAEHDALVARLMNEGGGRIDPDRYAAGMAQISAKYPGFETPPGSSAQWARDVNAYLDAGGKTVPSGVQLQDRELSNVEWLRNSVVNNPVGSFAANLSNAGGFGIPSLLAPDQFATLRDERPVSSLLGEATGSVTGTMGVGAGLNALAGKVTNQTIAKLLANPLTTDVAYGATYGATQADDPLIGAVTGAGSSFFGNRAGNWLGKHAPILTGVRRPADALLPSERAVYDAASRTGTDEVARLLAQGQNLGVPMSLADASPDVHSLTGAALRRSPEAAGNARTALAQRSRGQYDRLLGAIERDLGPIENIPQRSEDLITQARSRSRPLYERAYAAPGAETIDLSDLANRPTFEAALREAYQEVLDEGLDPSAVGLQQAGDNIMVAAPSWQALDYVKRGLDNIIERNTSKLDGLTPDGRRAVAMKNDLLSRMDAANPDYAAARAAYAGPASERAMLARGQGALRASPNQLGVDAGKATEAQLSQMQLGFQSALADQAGGLRNSTNPYAILDTPAMEQRLGALQYGDDEIARLLSQRDLEGRVAGSTNRLIGNSVTAERLAADQAFGESGLVGDLVQGGIETAVTGAPVMTAARSTLGRRIGQGYRDWRTLGVGRRAAELADGIAPIALDMGRGEQILADLAARDNVWQKAIVEALLKSGSRGAHAGGAAGAVIAAELAR